MLPSSSDLMYFYQAAIQSNLSRAAKVLNISQPTLSIGIKRIETQLGATLFIRHKQGVSLTKAGFQLLESVQQLKNFWSDTLTSIKSSSDSIRGLVHIGCHSTFASFLAPSINQFMQNNPFLQIHLHHMLTPEILNKLVSGTLDIGFVTEPYPHQDIVLQQINYTEFSILSSYPVDITNDDFFLLCDPQLIQTQYLLNELYKLRSPDQFRVCYVNQIESIASLCAQGCGLGILPTQYCSFHFKNILSPVPLAPVYKKPLYIAFRAESKEVYSIRTLINEFRTIADS